MCDPITIGVIAVAAGSGMQAYGAREEGKYARKVANNNAKAAQQQAVYRQEQASEDKRKLGLQVAKIRGQGRTGFAAGNVALGSGSVLDWDAGMTDQYLLDRENIDYNASLDVWGLETQAVNYRNEGRQAYRQGQMKSASALIGGVTQITSLLTPPKPTK